MSATENKNHCLRTVLLLPCAWLLVLATVFVPAIANAACEDGAIVCQSTSANDDGSTVSQTFDLGFSTAGQSIWAPGQTSANLGVTLVDPASTGWGGSLKKGSISRYCRDDMFDSVFGDWTIAGYSVAGWFKSEMSNPCYSFGAKVEASLYGDVGFSMDVLATEGEASVNYPVGVTIDYPSDTTFGPGDDIEITTALAVKSDAQISATSPHTSIVPTLSASIRGKGYVKGCIDSCSSTTAYDIDEHSSNTVELPLQGPGSRLQMNPLLSDTESPSQIFGFLLGATGYIGSPLTTTTVNEVDYDTLTLTAQGQDDFIDLLIDVDGWLMRFAGVPINVVGGYRYRTRGTDMGWGALNLGVNVDATLKQQNTFTPTFYIDFSFSHAIGYDVLDSGSLVNSGTGNTLTVEAGQSIVLHIPEDHRGEITVNSSVRQTNSFKTIFKQQQDSSLDVRALEAYFTTPKATIFNSYCFTIVGYEVCTPKWTWWGTTFTGDPVIDQPNLAPVSTEYFVYNPEPWELGGFQTFSLNKFNLVPNTPPEISVPEVILVEADTLGGTTPGNGDIQDWLTSASSLDFEDGPLSVTHTSLPAHLAVGQTYEVTFSAVDSYGQSVEDVSSISIVDTTPPVLSLDNLTVVAEGAKGSFIPDDASTVSDWLASLTVLDVADDTPAVTDTIPEFLDLGTNTIGFVATDASGNSASISVDVYVQAPFVLFAENSIRIDRSGVVETGMTVTAAINDGPWLSKKAQAEIGKYSVLGPEAPLYSDNVRLESSSIVDTGYLNYLDGKGTVLNQLPYVLDIYFPLDGLPAFAAGTENIQIGCKGGSGKDDKKSGKSSKKKKSAPCLASGSILDAGSYGDLKINKGKQHTPHILYLAGGTYIFSSVELDDYGQVIALAPSVILIDGQLETDKGASIEQNFGDEEEGGIIIMVAGYDDSKHSEKGDDNGRRSNKLDIKKFAVSLGRENSIEATIYASNGSVEVGKRSTVVGALVGVNIDIEEEVTLRFKGGI